MKLGKICLGLITVLISTQASAAFITLNAANFENGSDVSHALPGATLSVAWGYEGDLGYSSAPMTVHDGSFASADPAAPFDGTRFTSIWALLGVLPIPGSGILRADSSIFRVDFDTPTNYIELWGMTGGISMLLEAFNSDGQMVGVCATHDHPDVYNYPPGQYDGCWSHFGSTTLENGGRQILASTSVIRPTADIAYIRAATSFGGSATFDQITYNRVAVPEPTTLGLLGLGLFGVTIARRRRLKSGTTKRGASAH